MAARRLLSFLASAIVVVAACGGGRGPDEGAGAGAGEPAPVAPTTPAAAAGSSSPLPAIEVDNVTSGERVRLDSFLPADRPVLVWFWAPH